jgi:hypothetical protein
LHNEKQRKGKKKSGATSTVSSSRVNSDINAFGFDSEAIFSQVVKNENGSPRDSSQQTVLLTDEEETQAEGKYDVKVPSFHLDLISDEERDADDEELPSLVNPQRRCVKKSTSAERRQDGRSVGVHEAVAERKSTSIDRRHDGRSVNVHESVGERKSASADGRSVQLGVHSAAGERKFSAQDIKDKEFWSDQDDSSSDDDTPLLQLNPAKLPGARNGSTSSKPKGNNPGAADVRKTAQPLFSLQRNFSSLFQTFSPMKLPKSCDVKNSLSVNPRVESQIISDSNLKKEPGVDRMDVESDDDETQPFDDDSLPDISPLPKPNQSIKRESSPDLSPQPRPNQSIKRESSPDLSPQPRPNQSTKRESSPDLSPQLRPNQSRKRESSLEIFKEELSDDAAEVHYTQTDNCIYIEDSEEEQLSQSLFQEEVKLELGDSSDDEVRILDDSDEESWREILELDDSDDNDSLKNEVWVFIVNDVCNFWLTKAEGTSEVS